MTVLAVAASASGWSASQRFETFENEYFDNSNNTRATADPLLGPGQYPPSYYYKDDIDYYHLSVTAVPTTLSIYVDGMDWGGGLGDPEAWIEDGSGNVLAYHDDIAIDVLDCILGYAFVARGDYYVVVQHSDKSFYTYNHSNYYLTGTLEFGDTRPPGYHGPIGVSTAQRLSQDGFRSILLTWNAATDDHATDDQIRYNVYVSSAAAQVFQGSPAATFVGVTTGRITGLDPKTDYWIGVRAQDLEGNEEANAHIIEAAVSTLTAVRRNHWMLYR